MTQTQNLDWCDVASKARMSQRNKKSKRDNAAEDKLLRLHNYGDDRWRGDLVYFIQTESGAIKIGVSSLKAIKGRIDQMRTNNHESLEVKAILIVDDALKLERKLHSLLAEHNRHLEWFNPDDRVLSVMELAKAGRLDMIEALIAEHVSK